MHDGNLVRRSVRMKVLTTLHRSARHQADTEQLTFMVLIPRALTQKGSGAGARWPGSAVTQGLQWELRDSWPPPRPGGDANISLRHMSSPVI